MADFPSVAVIIPAFNAAGRLRRAVESIWATAYPNLTVAIIDDGSTDGTARVAEALCAESSGRCVLLQHPDRANHGVSISRNLGIERTRSEWVAFLDSDDTYLPHRFACLRGPISEADAYYGLTRMCFEVASVGEPSWWSGQGDDLFGIRQSLTDIGLLEQLLKGRCWATSAITLRRNLLERVGGFDPNKSIAEDCDLWFRVAALGKVQAMDLSRPVSCYHRHGDNTYVYRLEHRIPMLRAMLDAAYWARGNDVSKERLMVFRDAIPHYALRALIAAREAGRKDVAWGIIRLMAECRIWRFFKSRIAMYQFMALLRS